MSHTLRYWAALSAMAAATLIATACGGGAGSTSANNSDGTNGAGGSGGATASLVTPTSVTTTDPLNKATMGMVRAIAADGSTTSSLVMMTGTFDITVAAQAGLTCKVDADGDGVFEYIRPNCTSFQQVHKYRLGSAVGVTPKMQIENSSGTVITQYSWYARLDEDTILPNASRTTWDKVGVTYPANGQRRQLLCHHPSRHAQHY
jgi:ABC-type transport system substrate-binding protein